MRKKLCALICSHSTNFAAQPRLNKQQQSNDRDAKCKFNLKIASKILCKFTRKWIFCSLNYVTHHRGLMMLCLKMWLAENSNVRYWGHNNVVRVQPPSIQNFHNSNSSFDMMNSVIVKIDLRKIYFLRKLFYSTSTKVSEISCISRLNFFFFYSKCDGQDCFHVLFSIKNIPWKYPTI